MPNFTGVIASPREAALIRALPEAEGRLIVTPGVRPAGADLGDQKRVETPASAIAAGADHIVVGRPVWQAADPRAAAQAALADGRSSLVWRRLIADNETPVGAAAKLMLEGRGDFLLESVQGGEVRGRYSMIGLDPDLIWRCEGGRASRAALPDLAAFAPDDRPPLESLRALIAESAIPRSAHVVTPSRKTHANVSQRSGSAGSSTPKATTATRMRSADCRTPVTST